MRIRTKQILWNYYCNSQPHSCLTLSLRRNPSKFLDQTYHAKTIGMVYCTVKLARS